MYVCMYQGRIQKIALGGGGGGVGIRGDVTGGPAYRALAHPVNDVFSEDSNFSSLFLK